MIAQLWTAFLLGVATIGAGAGITSWLSHRLPLPTATRIALVGATGLAFLGLATLLLGHLQLLGPWLPYGLAGAGVLLGLLGRNELIETVSRGWRGMIGQFRRYPIPLVLVSLCLTLAAFTVLAPPSRRDEIEYHWPAPLDWAAKGGWSDSPFRHVDAFPFMEVLYTAAATQESYVAAHLLHFGSFIVLGFAVAGVAASMKVRGTGVTAAAALAMPVVWDSSYAAYNDTPVAAFSMVAVGVVLAVPQKPLVSAGAAGALIALATSVKPSGIVAAGVVGLIILMRYMFPDRSERNGTDVAAPGVARRGPFSRVLLQWVTLVGPSVIALAFWSVRQYLYTGHLIDPALRGGPSAEAQSRLPDAVDRLLAPLLPFVSGIVGSSEPWGGRTAVVIQLFLIPAIIYVVWRRGDVARRFSLMVVPAWAHWLILGLANVRTRFHIISWAMMVVGLRVAVEDFADRYPRTRVWLESAWTACIVLGLIDVSFEMFRHLRGIWA